MADIPSQEPAFTRLPPEILVMIADWLMYQLQTIQQRQYVRVTRFEVE